MAGRTCQLSVDGERTKNLAFSRGDTLAIDLALTNGSAPEDLTGSKLYFTIKEDTEDADAEATVRKTSPSSGITIVSSTGGTAQVVIAAADTAAVFDHLPASSVAFFFFDVQLKLSGGQVYTVAEGTALVYPDVTISTS